MALIADAGPIAMPHLPREEARAGLFLTLGEQRLGETNMNVFMMPDAA
jgi:hypothetical protein